MKKLILGTYTRSDSEGIYTIDLNDETNELENLQLVAVGNSPTYLALDDQEDFVFAIHAQDDQGGIRSFKKDGINLEVVDDHLEDGSAPCYVAYDNERQLVYTANYHQGYLQVLSVDEDGKLTPTDTIHHQGSGPHPNQEKPHAHFLDQTPDKNFVVSCNLGTDEVHTYRVSDQGKLEEVAKLDVKPGSGPRHLTFHPDGSHAYIVGELDSSVIIAQYDSETGQFTVQDQVSSLPEDFDGENSGAAIRISKDGKYLYASNRGHDSIAIFEVQDDYSLKALDWVPSHGQTPRDFNLSDDENYLVVGHQHENKLSLFERDSTNGKLTLLQKDVYAPEVVCLKFLSI